MVNVIQQFESAFTCDEFPHAMFYEFEIGLRFELGGEEVSTSRPIKRFIQAFERADAVSSELFEKSKSLWLLSSSYSDDLPKKKRLKPFKLCGIRSASFRYLGATPQQDENQSKELGSDLYRHWDAAELDGRDRLREVLWLALGSELGVRPTVQAKIYIVDFEKNIALHPYDDRGMDVVSMDKEYLSDLYETHKSWLLEYDISRMRAVFESSE